MLEHAHKIQSVHIVGQVALSTPSYDSGMLLSSILLSNLTELVLRKVTLSSSLLLCRILGSVSATIQALELWDVRASDECEIFQGCDPPSCPSLKSVLWEFVGRGKKVRAAALRHLSGRASLQSFRLFLGDNSCELEDVFGCIEGSMSSLRHLVCVGAQLDQAHFVDLRRLALNMHQLTQLHLECSSDFGLAVNFPLSLRDPRDACGAPHQLLCLFTEPMSRNELAMISQLWSTVHHLHIKVDPETIEPVRAPLLFFRMNVIGRSTYAYFSSQEVLFEALSFPALRFLEIGFTHACGSMREDDLSTRPSWRYSENALRSFDSLKTSCPRLKRAKVYDENTVVKLEVSTPWSHNLLCMITLAVVADRARAKLRCRGTVPSPTRAQDTTSTTAVRNRCKRLHGISQTEPTWEGRRGERGF